MSEVITSGNKKESGQSVRPVNIFVSVIFISIFFGIIALMGLTIFMQEAFCGIKAVSGLDYFKQIICWFDPVFMIYNLCLLLLLVMIVPVITLSYVHSMRDRKKESLLLQLSESEKNKNITAIQCCLDETFDIRRYAGSMTLLSIVILLGGMIILLLKPMPVDHLNIHNAFGVDYSKGANFLMLGSYMQYFIEGSSREYMRVLIATLTAFQFGFLGAYVYFITHLVRSYFTLDLSPNIYISCAVRIIMGSVLSLILSFYIISNHSINTTNKTDQTHSQINTQDKAIHEPQGAGLRMSNSYYYLPMLSFFIGFFPLRGLLVIERIAGSALHIMPDKNQSTRLSNLTGMSYQHEIRLNREGFDNVENLVGANITRLFLCTGFSYQQLKNWHSEAILVAHFGQDYARFRQATGINNHDELINNADLFLGTHNDAALNMLIDESLYQKAKIILNTISKST